MRQDSYAQYQPKSYNEDRLGLAVASDQFSEIYRRLTGADGKETAIELTYRAVIEPWLAIQPDLQYIINPGADAGLDDAVSVGIRLEAKL